MKVIIVGGGIAGLATAAFLRERTDAHVHILERGLVDTGRAAEVAANSGELSDYGIAVAPNGSACLSLLGMHDHVKELEGGELTEILVRTANNLEPVAAQPFPARQMFGVPSVFCLRSALLRWLYDRCVQPRTDGREEVRLTNECRVQSIDAVHGVVHVDGGEVYTGDLVICADGIAKEGRAAVARALREGTEFDGEAHVQQEQEAEFIVQCIYMAKITPAQIEQRPALHFLLHGDEKIATSCTGRSTLSNWCHGHPRQGVSEEEAVQAWRRQLRLIMYPVDAFGNHQLFATVPATEKLLAQFGRRAGSTDEGGEPLGRGRTSVLRNMDSSSVYEAYHMFHEDMRSLLKLQPQMDLGLMRDSDPLHRWSVAGKTVLVGDAAHASIQHTGQGSAQALEDAETLSYFLANYMREAGDGKPSSNGLQQVLSDFEQMRIPRAHHIQHAARMACGMAPGMEEFDFEQYNVFVHSWKGTESALLKESGQR